MKIVAQFEIPYYQILNEESQIVDTLPAFAKQPKNLLRLYRWMVLNRLFDTKAIALQRTGKIGTYPSTLGQEAAFVGIGDAMDKKDIFVPYYRDIGTLIVRGVKLSEILLYWGGDERGNDFAENSRDFPFSVPVGSQPLYAAGAAAAAKIRGEKHAVLTTLGEGATSQGDFYEAMNVAGVWKLPLVFVVINNGWAISVPRSAQTATATIAEKAISAGFSGEVVDGNDILAIHHRVTESLQRAREKNQPTLLELVCYRQGDHTTADDARRYEPKQNREQEWKKEPIQRLRRYLESLNLWSEAQEKECQAECTQQIETAVNEYINTPYPAPETMFDFLYETLPDVYEEQRESVKSLGVAAHG